MVPGETMRVNWKLIASSVLVISAAMPSFLHAQAGSRSAALAGLVRDSLGLPVVGAEVLVDGGRLRATTDDSGRFHLAGVLAGPNGFTVRRVGYSAVSFETTLAPDTTLVVEIRLKSLQALDAVVVSAAAEMPGLARAGFYERQRFGTGKYLAPPTIDSMSHLSTPSQLLRSVAGLEVRCRALGCNVQSRLPPYCLHLFVDGRYESGTLDEALTTGVISAIEVYRHPSTIPTAFVAPLPAKSGRGLSQSAGCGALVVWTKAKG